METGDAQPFGSSELDPATGLRPPPCRSRPGIEKHTRNRQIEPDTCAFRAVDAVEQRCEPIDATGLEVSPPAVKGDIERRVAAAYLVRNIVGDAGKPIEVEDEVHELVALACVEHLVAALAYCSGVEQRGGCGTHARAPLIGARNAHGRGSAIPAAMSMPPPSSPGKLRGPATQQEKGRRRRESQLNRAVHDLSAASAPRHRPHVR